MRHRTCGPGHSSAYDAEKLPVRLCRRSPSYYLGGSRSGAPGFRPELLCARPDRRRLGCWTAANTRKETPRVRLADIYADAKDPV